MNDQIKKDRAAIWFLAFSTCACLAGLLVLRYSFFPVFHRPAWLNWSQFLLNGVLVLTTVYFIVAGVMSLLTGVEKVQKVAAVIATATIASSATLAFLRHPEIVCNIFTFYIGSLAVSWVICGLIWHSEHIDRAAIWFLAFSTACLAAGLLALRYRLFPVFHRPAWENWIFFLSFGFFVLTTVYFLVAGVTSLLTGIERAQKLAAVIATATFASSATFAFLRHPEIVCDVFKYFIGSLVVSWVICRLIWHPSQATIEYQDG